MPPDAFAAMLGLVVYIFASVVHQAADALRDVTENDDSTLVGEDVTDLVSHFIHEHNKYEEDKHNSHNNKKTNNNKIERRKLIKIKRIKHRNETSNETST